MSRDVPRGARITGPLIKSVLFVVVTVTATAILALSIASGGASGTVTYHAVFSDVTGLNPGDPVTIAGVRVGQVDAIGITGRRLAGVSFSLQPGHPLPASATAAVKYQNLAGQRYLQLGQGTGVPGRALPPGGTIPLARTTPPLNLTELFNGFQPLFTALSPGDVNQLATELVQVLQGEGGTMTALISHIGALTSALAARSRVIDQVIANLNAVLGTINSRGGELAGLVTTVQQLVSGLAADRQPIGSAISGLADLTSATAGLLQAGRPALRTDIGQLRRLSATLAASPGLVTTFLRRLPAKMTSIARLASYGSWLNFYLCDANLTGVQEYLDPVAQPPVFASPAPSGIPVTAARCGG